MLGLMLQYEGIGSCHGLIGAPCIHSQLIQTKSARGRVAASPRAGLFKFWSITYILNLPKNHAGSESIPTFD